MSPFRESVIPLGFAYDFGTLLGLDARLALDGSKSGHLKDDDDLCIVVEKGRRSFRPNNNAVIKNLSKRASEIAVSKGVSQKDAFFYALFGNPDRPQRVRTVEGVGFYLDEIPEYVIRKFLNAHSDTFCQGDKEKNILADVNAGVRTLPEIFNAYYSSKTGCSGHWGAAIADIISRESGISMELWEDEGGEKYNENNRPSVMFTERKPWEMNEVEKELSYSSLVQILDRYALELHTEVDDGVYFTMRVDI